MTLTIAPRPEGQRDDYLFLEAEGRRYKALHELRNTPAAQPALVISLAPVDAEGHALVLADGEADVTWHTHVFTETELSDPAFDADARVAAILRELVERKAAEIVAREKVAQLSEAWRGGAIDLGGANA